MSKLDDSLPLTDDGTDDGEMLAFEESGTSEDNEFDLAVGALEEVMMDSEFESTQTEFFARYAPQFEDSEENKIEYTGIFNEYTRVVEGTLENLLARKMPGFNMRQFERMIGERKDQISGEIFEMLLSFTDFQEFKEQILAYKRGQELFGPTGNGAAFTLHGQGGKS